MTHQEPNQFEKFTKDNPEAGPEKQESVPADKSLNSDDQLTDGKQTPEIATNDGSVIETLDTAFHGIPGWSDGENISGSNRADYYETRSSGKSDAEEELDEIRERNKKEPDTTSKQS